IAVVLAAVLNECTCGEVGKIVVTLLELPVASRARREVEGRGPSADRGRSLDVRIHVAGEPALGGSCDFAVDPRLLREHDVKDLALARIIRPVEVAGAELDADNLLRRNLLEGNVERLSLGARPRSVDHDITRSACKAAHVDAALLGLGGAE